MITRKIWDEMDHGAKLGKEMIKGVKLLRLGKQNLSERTILARLSKMFIQVFWLNF